MQASRLNKFFTIIKQEDLYLFVFATSFAVSAGLVLFFWSEESFVLQAFPHRAIGKAIVAGSDSGKRSEVFFFLCYLLCGAFILSVVILTFLSHLLRWRNLFFKTKIERTTIIQVTLLSLPCLVFEALHMPCWNSLKLLTGALIISLLLIIIKIFFTFFNNKTFLHTLSKYRDILLYFLSLSGVVYAFFAYSNQFSFPVYGYHSYVVFIVSLLFVHCKGNVPLSKQFFVENYSLFLIPVSWPLLHPFACELHYFLSKYFSIQQYLVYWLTIFLFSVVCGSLLNRFYFERISKRKIITICFNIIILTFTVFVYWKSQFVRSTGDLMHPSNLITSAKRFVVDGAIPLIDYWPIRGLLVTLPSSLYDLIFGFHELESLVWGFMPRMIGGVSLFILLKNFFSEQWAFLVVLFIPFVLPGDFWIDPSVYWFPNRLSYALFWIAYVGWMMKSFSLPRLYFLCFLSLACVALIPSTGKSVLVTTFFMVILLCFQSNYWKERFKIVCSVLTVFCSAFAVYCVILHLRGYQLDEYFTYTFTQGIAEKYVFSHTQIVKDGISGLAIWYYALLPMLLFGVGGVCVFRVVSGKPLTSQQWVLYTAAILSIFVGTRALQRHGLNEIYTPSYTILVIALLPALFNVKEAWRLIWASLIFVFAALIIPLSSINGGLQLHPKVTQWEGMRPSRVIIRDSPHWLTVTDFMKTHLRTDQTYLEFIHGRLLYALSEHKIPNYHRSPRLISCDVAQNIYLKYFEQDYLNDKIPLIIADGSYWGSAIDGVPSRMATYRISEFINQHYEPFVEVSGLRILRAKNSSISLTSSDYFTLSHTSFDEGQTFAVNNTEIQTTEEGIKAKATGKDPYISHIFNYSRHPVYLLKNAQYVVHVKMKSSKAGELKLYPQFSNKGLKETHSRGIQIEKSDRIKTYSIYLPKLRDGKVLTDLRLDYPEGADVLIESVKLCEELHEANKAKPLYRFDEHFPLGKVAYLWANFDKEDRWKTTDVLADLSSSLPDKVVYKATLIFPDSIDKKKGNYLQLQIYSPKKGRAELFYGEPPKSSFSFSLVPSKSNADYLIRLSSQWAWVNQPVGEIRLSFSEPVKIKKAVIRSGD